MKQLTPRWGHLKTATGVGDVWEHLIARTFPPSRVVVTPGARIDLCVCKDREITDECDLLLRRKPFTGSRKHYCSEPARVCAYRTEGVYPSPRVSRATAPKPQPFKDVSPLREMEWWVLATIDRIADDGPPRLRPIATAMVQFDFRALKGDPTAAMALVFDRVARIATDEQPWREEHR